jgi:hypothetical protein
MSDFISSIRHITPTYPVKPVQPAQKDRQTDRRQKPKYEPQEHDDRAADDHDEENPKPTIDEHI